MQVPEKLSLIGGSILLASTLVFTLKSQASDILPKVDSGISNLMKSDQERQQDQQKQQEQAFNDSFQQAQQKGWQTGQWGTATFYVDDQNNMHVGSGQLNGSYTNLVDYNKIKTISLDENVQAPQDSSNLFATTGAMVTHDALQSINNLNRLNTSQTIYMNRMFYSDTKLQNLDINNFDTSNVTNMESMFDIDASLTNLNVSHFDTHNVNNMNNTFGNEHLTNLDLSHFNVSQDTNVYEMLEDDNIHQLSLGSNTNLSANTYLDGTYQSNGQTLSLDGNAHPGTWIKQ